MRYKIVAVAQVHNELRKGNLERFFTHLTPLVDAVVIYDDASTDGSYEYAQERTPHVIRGKKNDFAHERAHRKRLLHEALGLNPDFILWLDADEVLSRGAKQKLQELAAYADENNIDGLSMREVNLWRSRSWQRTDNMYDGGWFVRLWRVTPGLAYTATAEGLHQPMHPDSIERIQKTEVLSVIHYGFASEESIIRKYLTYRKYGQTGWELHRLIDESTLVARKVNANLFPDGLYVDDNEPQAHDLQKWIRTIEDMRESIERPAISIVCLIYKSTTWLQFVYEQVLRYTEMRDKEFFFVANDASESVRAYLREHYIPHYVFDNTEQHRQEWYINNVYRAWNFGANVARGDYVMFINSDMAFSPEWLENAFGWLNGRNCVATRLVESGKMPSGKYGISKDFGQVLQEYDEQAFLSYARKISKGKVVDGGLFMPLLIRREDLMNVGGYPEGNVAPGSDPFDPTVAKEGESAISGDVVLMDKLSTIGVTHQTAFDSIAYHFQEGEMDDYTDQPDRLENATVVVANDTLYGQMGEKTMWNFLLEALPRTAPLDQSTLGGERGAFASAAHTYIENKYPSARIVIQNATFMDIVMPDLFTIAYLQDDLRRMGRASKQQELNLAEADVLVTNSAFTAASYPEHAFEIIPIGVDDSLFSPGDKIAAREKHQLPKNSRVGIFVGDLSEVKGWSKVRGLIEAHQEITWIVVSKDNSTYSHVNVRMFNKLSQDKLAELYRAADFFILGSPVETQCLAALEACMTNIPVIMHTTGMFSDFTEEERSRCGVFGDDFEQALEEITRKTFSPRTVCMERELHVGGMIRKWEKLLVRCHQTIAIRKARNLPPPAKRSYVRRIKRPRLFLKHRARNVLSRMLPDPVFRKLIRVWRTVRTLF